MNKCLVVGNRKDGVTIMQETEFEKEVEKKLGYTLPDGGDIAVTDDDSIVSTAEYNDGEKVRWEITKGGDIFYSHDCGPRANCKNADRVRQSRQLDPKTVEKARELILAQCKKGKCIS